ncbi:MAG: MerR family transcriptional regulator [Gammaproteobacteria bacterium]|nr:MAG: MerR family transcriptional regulator [Gammaproteobacteria bacterium]
MQVRHLAKFANVTPETVRYYTREGLLSPARDPNNGYKIYDAAALQRLQFIIQAKALGFSLKDIKNIVDNAERGQSPCPMVRGLLAAKIKATEEEIKVLKKKLTMMKKTALAWQDIADALPSEQSLCPLIESVGYDK